MRFGKEKENGEKEDRIKIKEITYFDVKTQTIFFDVLTEKKGEKKYYKDLFINLSRPVRGRSISAGRKFSLRVNNYLSDLRTLEVKIFTPKLPKIISEEAIYLVAVSLEDF